MKREVIIIAVIAALLLLIVLGVILRRPPAADAPSSDILIEKAENLLAENNIIEARNAYRDALEHTYKPQMMAAVRQKLEELNMMILFSSVADSCSTSYTVKPNDTLSKIAKQYGTTVALIKKANGLDSDIIKPEQKLKVHTCAFSIAIDKSQNLLFLKQNDIVIKTYRVSTGRDNSTPVGKFTITSQKLKNPTWFRTGAVVPPDSPENILGSRWMGLSVKGYGIHGNRNVNEIGKQVTAGCIRMKNKEVEELFDIVPVGTEVVIVD